MEKKLDLALVNVSKKLQLYLLEKQLSILKFSQDIPDIKYQTLKRMVEYDGSGSLPNIASLATLADFFACSVSELVSNQIGIKIKSYSTINKFCCAHEDKLINLYVSVDEPFTRKAADIFAIQTSMLNVEKPAKNGIAFDDTVSSIQLFVKMSAVEYEGYYIAEVKNKVKIIKVISVSSSNLMTEENEQVINLETTTVKIKAKFIGNGIIISEKHNLLIAYNR